MIGTTFSLKRQIQVKAASGCWTHKQLFSSLKHSTFGKKTDEENNQKCTSNCSKFGDFSTVDMLKNSLGLLEVLVMVAELGCVTSQLFLMTLNSVAPPTAHPKVTCSRWEFPNCSWLRSTQDLDFSLFSNVSPMRVYLPTNGHLSLSPCLALWYVLFTNLPLICA